jgi:arylsulfatase A-like enzyme
MGVSFSNAFCSTALCNPSRTSILTGQSPFTTGVHDNRDDWTTSVDPAEMLPNFFRQAGYDALAFGKILHVLPPATGLQLFDAYSDHALAPDSDVLTRDALNVEDAIAALAARNDADPLLLMVGLHDPHVPLVSPSQFTDLYPLDEVVLPDGAEYPDMPEFVRSFIESGRSPDEIRGFIQRYFTNITEMDARLGTLLDAVEADPEYDPVIALWSDHGYSLGDVDHDHIGKFTLWDETGRTPLIIVDPEAPSSSRGVIYDGVVSTLDLAPTLFALAGVPVPASMQGQPLTNILADPSTIREGVALTTMFGSVSIRTNDWRYTRYEDGSEELFHVATDPENVVNLAGDPAYAAVQGEMRDALIAELAEVGAAIDEDRNIVSVNAGAGDSTYFLTAARAESAHVASYPAAAK